MGIYVAKRFLLMIPTLILISFLIFIIIQLAPGRPGQMELTGGAGESVREAAGAREGYVLFKLQYGLDKPTVLNFRFGLDYQDVEQAVETVASNLTVSIPGETEALHVGRRAAAIVDRLSFPEYWAYTDKLDDPSLVSPAKRASIEDHRLLVERAEIDPFERRRPEPEALVEATENLENWGMYAVPHLFRVAVEHRNPKTRWQAVEYLTLNAQDRYVDEDGAIRSRHNVQTWTYPLGATGAPVDEVMDRWRDWIAANSSRWEYDFWEKVEIALTDTRLFAYWDNLLHGNFGISSHYRRPVTEVIFERWQYSIYLSLLSVFFAYFLSIPIGLYSAVKQGGVFDRGMGLFLFLLYSLPSFFVATLLQDYLSKARDEHVVFTILEWIVTLFFAVVIPLFVAVFVRNKSEPKMTLHRELRRPLGLSPGLVALAAVILGPLLIYVVSEVGDLTGTTLALITQKPEVGLQVSVQKAVPFILLVILLPIMAHTLGKGPVPPPGGVARAPRWTYPLALVLGLSAFVALAAGTGDQPAEVSAAIVRAVDGIILVVLVPGLIYLVGRHRPGTALAWVGFEVAALATYFLWQAVQATGMWLLATLLIVAWPLWATYRRWRREAREGGGDPNLPLVLIGRFLGVFVAGCAMTGVIKLAWDFFPAPVSGFSTEGLKLDTTLLTYFGDVLTHLVFPVGCLTYGYLAILSRYARTGLLDVIRSDYIRTARAKGLSEPMVILKHAVRNGMIPILTLLGSTLPILIGGSIVIEYIFNIPGLGQLMLFSVHHKDYNVIMGILQIAAVLTLVGLLLSDISYALVDPRISFD